MGTKVSEKTQAVFIVIIATVRTAQLESLLRVYAGEELLMKNLTASVSFLLYN